MAEQRTAVRIGTRKSNLAMWQANMVCRELRTAHPDVDFEVVGMSTLGDRDQIKPLSDFAAKGVFTKELDIALLNGDIDLAVHCMKDLPTTVLDGMILPAILERGDRQDAVVLHEKHKGKSLEQLPKGSIIGTSALRRRAVLGKYYPHLECKNIRGNVNTRLAKLDNGEYDALILARTGLQRLEFEDRIDEVLDQSKFGYAVGQGALAIMTRASDDKTIQLTKVLEHAPTRMACAAERGMLKTLEGGCKVPIAVRTTIENMESGIMRITLFGAVYTLDGQHCVVNEQSGEVDLAKATEEFGNELGCALGQKLLAQGAAQILAGIKPEAKAAASLAAPVSS